MNSSCPGRALCTPDPVELQYLPLSDDDWNHGVCNHVSPFFDLRWLTPSQRQPTGAPYTLSTPVEVKMGKFTRLAQASHLLSRVLRHICDSMTDQRFLKEEREMLDQAIRSLLSLTVAEEMSCEVSYCSPVALLGR